MMIVTGACGKSNEVRKYKETSESTPSSGQKTHGSMSMSETPMDGGPSQVESHFKWQTPAGWTEEKATSSFRLATFAVKSGENTATCTIIPLQGEAGGLKANISRWLGQVSGKSGHTDPMLAEGDPVEVEKLMKKTEQFLTAGQFAAVMIDLTTVPLNPTDPAILATVITVGGSSVFVKMTGPKALLVENKAKFRSLCESFNTAMPTTETTTPNPHQNAL